MAPIAAALNPTTAPARRRRVSWRSRSSSGRRRSDHSSTNRLAATVTSSPVSSAVITGTTLTTGGWTRTWGTRMPALSCAATAEGNTATAPTTAIAATARIGWRHCKSRAPAAAHSSTLRRGQHELVPVDILENRRRSPVGFLRLLDELDAFRLEVLRRGLDVVGHEGDVHEPADHLLLPRRGEQYQLRVGARKTQLDPALRPVERAVGDDAEAELLRVELQRAILIADRNAGELDRFDHRSLRRGSSC